MADNTGHNNGDLPDEIAMDLAEQSPSSPSAQPSQQPTRADFSFDFAGHPFNRRRNALAAIPPPRLSRGDTTDTQPLTTGDWEEVQRERERDLAAAIPSEALSAARREALSERDAIMLAAKSRIEELEAKGKTDEQKIGALEKENVRSGGENERLMGELEGQGKGRDGDSDDGERAELRLENQRIREELQGMTE